MPESSGTKHGAVIASLSPAKRALLERRLAELTSGRARPGARPRREVRDRAPLSFAQERLWFLDQLEPGSTLYNFPACLPLPLSTSVAEIETALADLVARHEILRTTFPARDGIPEQRIHAHLPVPLTVVDRRGASPAARAELLAAVVAEDSARPFELETGPLVRAILLRFADQQVLVVIMHHIVTDGWSIDVLARDLAALLAARRSGQPARLPELPLQYGDYAAALREHLRGPVLEAELSYWRAQLAGAPPLLELPADRPRPQRPSYRGAVVAFTVPEEVAEPLRQLARSEGGALFMVLLAAFDVLLHRYTGRSDLVVGTPVANRARSEYEGLIGFFVNMLVLRTRVEPGERFRELVGRVREAALAAYSHQQLPFEKLVEELRPARRLDHHPIFQVMLTLRVGSKAERAGREGPAAVDVGALERAHRMAKFDLSVGLEDLGGPLAGSVEYATDLFERDRIVRLAEHFTHLLASIAADPDRRVAELELAPLPALVAELARWNQTAPAHEGPALVHQLFERRAREQPHRIAAVFEGRALSYGQLDAAADALAARLSARGVGPERVVGLCVDRSLEMIVAVLAILKAGGAWLPLDPALPRERLRAMLEGVAVVVAQRAHREALAEFAGEVLALDEPAADLPGGGEAPPRPAPRLDPRLDSGPGPGPGHPAYVIFTSGSTGTPKGVVVPHRGLLNRLVWMQETFRLTPDDRVVQKTPLGFDVSVWELLWPLMYGAALVIARPEGHRDSAYLGELFRRERVTVTHFVPSMLRGFLDDARACADLPLRLVVCSGEELGPQLCELAHTRLGAELHNLYGPTEASIDVTWWPCRRGAAERTVPIGRPIAGTRIYILDDALRPVPAGVPGELYIAGVGLARGYANRPGLTAERFLPDPYATEPGARMYRSGDLACRRPDGVIEFCGRVDTQVKLRGFRIELGEIESHLARRPELREACVALREDRPGDQRLVAYLVPREPLPPGFERALREALREHLPVHMLPAAYLELDALPKTPSGKLDRRALPAPRASARGVRAAPSHELERELAALWAQILDVEEIGVDDDFFELGGHSLLAAQVVARIRERHGVDLALRTLFERATVRGLAEEIDRLRALVADPAPGPGPAPGPAPAASAPAPAPAGMTGGEAAALLERLAELDADEIERALARLVPGYAAAAAAARRPAGPAPALDLDAPPCLVETYRAYVELAAAVQLASAELTARLHAARLAAVTALVTGQRGGPQREASRRGWDEALAAGRERYGGACAQAYLDFLAAHRRAWVAAASVDLDPETLGKLAELLAFAASDAGRAFEVSVST